MFYRCKSCGGNVTYNPDKKKMICESCGNEGEPELISQDKNTYVITVVRRLKQIRLIYR